MDINYIVRVVIFFCLWVVARGVVYTKYKYKIKGISLFSMMSRITIVQIAFIIISSSTTWVDGEDDDHHKIYCTNNVILAIDKCTKSTIITC